MDPNEKRLREMADKRLALMPVDPNLWDEPCAQCGGKAYEKYIVLGPGLDNEIDVSYWCKTDYDPSWMRIVGRVIQETNSTKHISDFIVFPDENDPDFGSTMGKDEPGEWVTVPTADWLNGTWDA